MKAKFAIGTLFTLLLVANPSISFGWYYGYWYPAYSCCGNCYESQPRYVYPPQIAPIRVPAYSPPPPSNPCPAIPRTVPLSIFFEPGSPRVDKRSSEKLRHFLTSVAIDSRCFPLIIRVNGIACKKCDHVRDLTALAMQRADNTRHAIWQLVQTVSKDYPPRFIWKGPIVISTEIAEDGRGSEDKRADIWVEIQQPAQPMSNAPVIRHEQRPQYYRPTPPAPVQEPGRPPFNEAWKGGGSDGGGGGSSGGGGGGTTD